MKLVLKLLFLAGAVGCVSCEGHFILAGPKFVRDQSNYQILATAHDYEECCPTLQLTIRNEKNSFERSETVILTNDETTNVTFDLKDHVNGSSFILEAKTLTGPYYQRSVLLQVAAQRFFAFIQTDKSTYKPSDEVQFRVLVLDADTKPFQASNVDVFISDSEDNRLKQYLGVELVHGVFRNKFQLSDAPALGTWHIHVNVNGAKEERKEFKVAKYVLPKYQLSVSSDSALTFKDDTLKVTVSAKYTYGKSVKGNATITVKSGHYKSVKTATIDGKKTIEFDLRTDLRVSPDDTDSRILEIDVNFVEELTGNEQIGKAKTSLDRNRHEIDIEFNKKKFKPGLPLRFEVHGKTTDGTPLSDLHNPLKITIVRWEKPIENYCHSEPLNETQLVPLKNGVATVHYNTSKDYEHLQISAEYLKESKIKHLEREVSKSPHYIQAEVLDKSPSVNQNLTVSVEATEELSTLHYQIVARGNVLASQTLNFTSKGRKQSFDLWTTFAMTPQAHVIVSYFRETGELVFDEIEINFANVLPNHINLELSQYETRPDGELTIAVKTSPNSYVGLLGIDQSALILGGGNDIQYADVFAKLNQGDDIKESNTDRFSIFDFVDDDYVNIGDENFMEQIDFDHSNSFMITNKLSKIESLTPTRNLGADDQYTSGCSEWKYLYPEKKICCKTEEQTTTLYRSDLEDLIGSTYYSSSLPQGLVQHNLQAGAAAGAVQHGPVSRFGVVEDLLDIRFGGEAVEYSFDDHSGVGAVWPSTTTLPKVEFGRPIPSSFNKHIPKFEIRKSFPETWFYDDFEMTDSDNGTRALTKTVPSAITSWLITGFSVNPSIGLGLTNEAKKLRVFQPFFVSTNLPYSIKRGEVVAIPIVVFNYLEYDLPVDVTLHNEHGEFEFIEIDDRDNSVHGRKTTNATRVKRTIAKSNDGASATFMIKPLKAGYITVKATATSAVAGDGVERQLLVEPEGVTKYFNKVILLDLKNESVAEVTQMVKIAIPPSAVPDSTKIEVGVVADIMGPSITNLEKLIKLPYGCGEQNMLNFVPNIVVLNYLTTVGKLTVETEERLIKYLESGYQRELMYKHEDGSYSAFGKSDSSGSTWLTAFVAKSFRQADKFISIDEKIITEALQFLKNVQMDNGKFPEVGTIVHKDMQGGSSNGIALTAYVLMAFLENGKYHEDFKNTTDKAVKYIADNIDAIADDDSYSLAIAAYAMQLANHPDKSNSLDKLKSKAERKNGEMFWSKRNSNASEAIDRDDHWFTPKPKSLDVEMTAYAMHAIIKAHQIPDAVPVMKWLLKQRNENGGFESTQDTVVGLQALALLAERVNVPDVSLEVSVTTDTNSIGKNFHIQPENTLLLQKIDIEPNARDFVVTARGRGFALLQIAYRYNVNETTDKPQFVLEPKVGTISSKDLIHLTVCAKFISPENDTKSSNMAVMEVAFPSGFSFDPDHLSELENSPGVKKVETQKQDTVVIVYFDSLNEVGRCPELKAYRTSKVANQKPAAVVVYDYYDNSYRVTEFYDPPETTLCDICEGDKCDDACNEEGIVTEKATPEFEILSASK